MKIAVTGASGFIGRHVLNILLRQQEIEVIAITRDKERLNDVASATCRIVEMDITNFKADCFEKLERPDVLIHLAWDGLPNYKSLHHFSTELPKQYQFLDALIKDGLPSLLVTGTCFEYGMQSGALSEDMFTIPNNPYGFAKDALRQQLQFLQTIQPFNFTWARLFYMYGESQPSSSLYPKLKAAIQCKDKVFNLSGGEQLRDYLPVESVADYIVRLALTEQNLGVLNVCSGEPISVQKIVEFWRKKQNWQIEFNFGYYPYPGYEPMAFWGNNNKLQSIFKDK